MMSEKELRLYIGGKIKEYRNKKKVTQEELGNKLGVKNNTISAYERGTISPDSDTLFIIADILEVKADDFFPPIENDGVDYLDKIKDLRKENLEAKDMRFFQKLIEKTLSMDDAEREKFIESIRFTVDYYDKTNRD
ncbi:hypothetical protein CWR48_04135 [Oceanobacillus arenosus]|uniref:HTH cro/C1-type domain-containing protein n=1 Tax=Oceanobacillus arenosus TaxID=1229153 RepID=A0A3D8Q0R7_9BACI|nr:helix-turn-helix domain-containing protein [Oceanobacillus arenosus]RDW21009.1 hypothetical protein CWR48_04135 [Oceanobacillus arenosus]